MEVVDRCGDGAGGGVVWACSEVVVGGEGGLLWGTVVVIVGICGSERLVVVMQWGGSGEVW